MPMLESRKYARVVAKGRGDDSAVKYLMGSKDDVEPPGIKALWYSVGTMGVVSEGVK